MVKGTKKKIAIGFIAYEPATAKYWPHFLPSLFAAINKAQKQYDFLVLAFDNTESKSRSKDNCRYLRLNYPQIEILQADKNIGFGRAYNKMIEFSRQSGADYFFVINPDTLLEPPALAALAAALDNDKNLAAASPKVLRWDFVGGKKTKIIDTVGIAMSPGLRFYDVGQGEVDAGQYDKAEIIGPSGAAGFFRLSALAKIANNGQYFDERFFMYKEDCDLAYRLFTAGLKARCVPEAVVYHDRTVAALGLGWRSAILSRRHKSRQVKKWSFFGQQLIFLKHWRRQDWRSKLAIVSYEIKAFIFILLFEPYLLPVWRQVIKIYRKHKLRPQKDDI